MRKLLIGFLLLVPSLAFAQQQQPPVSITVLQNMVGQLAGQNALLMQREQELTAQVTELQKQLDAAKKASPTPEPKPKK